MNSLQRFMEFRCSQPAIGLEYPLQVGDRWRVDSDVGAEQSNPMRILEKPGGKISEFADIAIISTGLVLRRKPRVAVRHRSNAHYGWALTTGAGCREAGDIHNICAVGK